MSRHVAPTHLHYQRGAAMMVMLVIMVMGALTFLVSSLSPASIRLSQQDVTAQALAQAKDALVGRAISDTTSPGSLPCPDITGLGSAESTVSPIPGKCPSYIGLLPWKSLGLPELRDGSGAPLWYAVSSNFRDYIALNPINSDSSGELTVTGTTSVSNVIAIVFAPGFALANQSRSTTQTALCSTTNTTIPESLCAANYLEGSNANLNTLSSPNLSFQIDTDSDSFNDHSILITHDQLFPAVEKRIAREVKTCLDEYAANSLAKYPWAAPVTDTSYAGTYNTFYGRISSLPNTNTSAGTTSAAVTTLNSALNALMSALDIYFANINAANQAILYNAGLYVISLKNTIPSINNTVDKAGDWGKDIGDGSKASDVTNYTLATNSINTAITAVAALSATVDPDMSTSWPASNCIFSNAYWASWRELVYYQIASGYQPGVTTPSCVGCLSIAGSGNNAAGNGSYRAAIILARKPIGGQIRDPLVSSTYLEGLNDHDATLTTTFETHRATDPLFSTANDLVLCLDGSFNCQ